LLLRLYLRALECIAIKDAVLQRLAW
jgi:hypothetical protein